MPLTSDQQDAVKLLIRAHQEERLDAKISKQLRLIGVGSLVVLVVVWYTTLQALPGMTTKRIKNDTEWLNAFVTKSALAATQSAEAAAQAANDSAAAEQDAREAQAKALNAITRAGQAVAEAEKAIAAFDEFKLKDEGKYADRLRILQQLFTGENRDGARVLDHLSDLQARVDQMADSFTTKQLVLDTGPGTAGWRMSAHTVGTLRAGESRTYRLGASAQNARFLVHVAGTHNNHLGAGNWNLHFVQTGAHDGGRQINEMGLGQPIRERGNGALRSSIDADGSEILLTLTNTYPIGDAELYDVIVVLSGYSEDFQFASR